MSVDHGGSTEEQRAESPRDSGRHVFAHLYESYAASLFDYCDGLLLDTLAAVDAVQDALVAADAQVGSAPGPDRLRLALYSAARRECLNQLDGGRVKLSSRAETTTLDELGAAVPDYEVAGPTGETVLILRAALDRLSERDREVLNLTFRHRLTEADLAAVIGVPPRKARALVSEASLSFDHSAPVIAVLRAAIREGRPTCPELGELVKGRNLATFPLTPQFASKLGRHLESCAACALSRGDRAFSAEQISEIPLAIPPGRLRLRISRTALAVGSYRRTLAGRPDKPDTPRGNDEDNPPVPLRPRRGVPKAMVLSSVALVALAVPTAILYRMTADPTHTPASVVKTVAASPSPTPAATTAISPQLDTPAALRSHKRHRPALPGVLTPAHLGELPVPLTGTGHVPQPLDSSSASPAPGSGGSGGSGGSSGGQPSPTPTTPAPTTQAPTPTPTPTPAPTTPAPTPTPSASASDPTPTPSG
jgi:RNA polymerase sigma factor (sigma-70 family)